MSEAPSALQRVPLPTDEQGRPREALVVLSEHEAPKAFLNLCPHLDVPLDAGSADFAPRRGHLICRTHGARFRLRDGLCIWGPCVNDQLTALVLERVGDRLVLVFEQARIEVARLETTT